MSKWQWNGENDFPVDKGSKKPLPKPKKSWEDLQKQNKRDKGKKVWQKKRRKSKTS